MCFLKDSCLKLETSKAYFFVQGPISAISLIQILQQFMITLILLCFLWLVIINNQLFINMAHVKVITCFIILTFVSNDSNLVRFILLIVIQISTLCSVHLFGALEITNVQASERRFWGQNAFGRIILCSRLSVCGTIEFLIQGSLLAKIRYSCIVWLLWSDWGLVIFLMQNLIQSFSFFCASCIVGLRFSCKLLFNLLSKFSLCGNSIKIYLRLNRGADQFIV
jgi:hypothetical protein